MASVAWRVRPAGGLAAWAVIGGSETRDGIGGSAHATIVALPDFDLKTAGIGLGINDSVELSYAYQRFDTHRAGAALGLGRGFTFGQHILSGKLRIAGDAVWEQDRWLPQIAIGVQHKIAERGGVIRLVGGRASSGTDVYASATKVLLAQSLVVDATVRWTKANQFGLLGFGGDRRRGRSAQFEGSVGWLATPSLLLGAEVRTKPTIWPSPRAARDRCFCRLGGGSAPVCHRRLCRPWRHRHLPPPTWHLSLFTGILLT